MLQEFHRWSPERQERWQKTREQGCLNYVLKVTSTAVITALAVCLIYGAFTLARSHDFQFATGITITIVGALSGLIIGKTKWNLSESSFKKMYRR